MRWITSNDKNDSETMNMWKKSGDQLKSNMKWSHINNEYNDGNDNDSESLREGHSSLSQIDMTKQYK